MNKTAIYAPEKNANAYVAVAIFRLSIHTLRLNSRQSPARIKSNVNSPANKWSSASSSHRPLQVRNRRSDGLRDRRNLCQKSSSPSFIVRGNYWLWASRSAQCPSTVSTQLSVPIQCGPPTAETGSMPN